MYSCDIYMYMGVTGKSVIFSLVAFTTGPRERKCNIPLHFETICIRVIFIGRLERKKITILCETAKLYDAKVLISSFEGSGKKSASLRMQFVLRNEVICLGNNFPVRYRVITISVIGTRGYYVAAFNI